MAKPTKPTPEATHGSYTSIPGMIGEWIRQGTEGFIATQKILLDLAAQQNALALTIARERLRMLSFGPTKPLADLAGKGIHNFMEAQRLLLELASKQNAIIADGLKPGIAHTPVAPLAEVVHKGLENFFNAQKHFLGVFEKQAEEAIKDLNQGKGFDTGRLGEIASEGVRDFIGTHKKFLDLVQHQIDGKGEKAPANGKKVDLFDVAKQSVDSLVEVEKRMLDLLSNQVDVDVKFVRELFNMQVTTQPATTLPELMKKSVDSFVAAQKALVELASQKRKEVEEDIAEVAASV
jgi:hypothetical protein